MLLSVSLLAALSLLLIAMNPAADRTSSYPQCIYRLISYLKDGGPPVVIGFISSDTNSELFCNPRVVCVTASGTVCIFSLSGRTVGADSDGVLRKGHRGLAFLFCCEVEG
jgi:hypothetical protein